MSRILRQSTASQIVTVGPFVDDTDYVTAETGLTIANTDIKLLKGGSTTQANKNSGGATHLANGVYYLTLDATDTNTVGPLEIQVKVAGALLVREVFYVAAGAWRDAMHATGSGIVADVWTWRGGSVPAVNQTGRPLVDVTHLSGTAEDVALGSEIAALNDPTAAAIADAVLDELLSGHTTAGSLGKAIADIEVDTSTTLDGKLNTIDGIVDAILVDTDVTIPGLIAALNDISVADILAGSITEPSNGDETFTGLTVLKVLGLIHEALWMKSTLNRTTGVFTQYKEDGTTALVTATDTDDGTTYTKAARS